MAEPAGNAVKNPHACHSPSPAERGFALLIVLWSLVLISLLTTQLVASGRTALALATNLRAAAAARATADGAINEALFHLLSTGPDRWLPDGSPHVIPAGNATVSVRITTFAGFINPNLASTNLLASLFEICGANGGQAQQIASAIIAWRSPPATKAAAQALLAAYRQAGLSYAPPGHNFADISELSDVIGMTPALLAAVRPHISLYQSGDPDPALADPLVRRALAMSGQTGASSQVYNGNALVVTISAEATGPGHLDIHRDAVISILLSGFQYLSVTGN